MGRVSVKRGKGVKRPGAGPGGKGAIGQRGKRGKEARGRARGPHRRFLSGRLCQPHHGCVQLLIQPFRAVQLDLLGLGDRAVDQLVLRAVGVRGPCVYG